MAAGAPALRPFFSPMSRKRILELILDRRAELAAIDAGIRPRPAVIRADPQPRYTKRRGKPLGKFRRYDYWQSIDCTARASDEIWYRVITEAEINFGPRFVTSRKVGNGKKD
jgi:hypothetical protein